MSSLGPQNVYLYKDNISIKRDFRLSETFLRTAEQLASGCFRWFRYQKEVRQVVVGRSVRDSDCARNAEPEQILRTWHRQFASVHELLCAVRLLGLTESLRGKALPLYDTDLGPFDPLPPDPINLGGEHETSVISAPGRLPQVTALAVAREGHRLGIRYYWAQGCFPSKVGYEYVKVRVGSCSLHCPRLATTN